MTIASLTNRNTYQGAGSVGPYAFNFRIFAADDLVVTKRDAAGVETLLVYNADYVLTTGVSVGDETGSITLTVALASGEMIAIRRSPAFLQPMSIRNQARYAASSIEDEIDRIVMQLQALQDRVDRSFGAKETYDPGTLDLLVAGEAGKVLGWDSSTKLTNKQLDSGAIALPGAGRTVASVSAYLANNATYNVADYGFAAGNTAQQNKTALELAIANAPDKSRIVFPPGTFNLAAPTFPVGVSDKMLTFEGDANLTVLVPPSTATGWFFDLPGAQFSRFINLDIRGATTLTGVVRISNLGCDFVNCRINTVAPLAPVGLKITNCVYGYFHDLFCYGTVKGLWIRPDAGVSEAVNANNFANIRTALATGGGYGCYIDFAGAATAESICEGNSFLNIDGTNCSTGLYSNGFKNIFVNSWFEADTAGFVDTDTAYSTFIGYHLQGGLSATRGRHSIFFGAATGLEWTDPSTVGLPVGGRTASFYDPSITWLASSKKEAHRSGAAAIDLCTVDAAGADSGFSTVIEVRVRQMGVGGAYCTAHGIASTNGATPTNAIGTAMTIEHNSGLGGGTLAWSVGTGSATLRFTPNASTSETFIEINVIQAKGNSVTIVL